MIPAIRKARSANLAALGTSSQEKATHLSQKHKLDCCYPAYQQVLEDPKIDGVYIGLPNHLHKEWTLKALAHGKHVLCDKPVAMNLQEAREMTQAAHTAGKLLMEGFMYRFHPQHILVKDLIQGGAIGKVRLFEAHFHYLLEDPENIRMKHEMGGGGLYDVGCYGINSARYIFSAEPHSVTGFWSLGVKSRVDEFCHFTMRFDKDRVAAVTCGTRLLREQSYAVYGDLGVIRVPHAYVPSPGQTTRVVISTQEGVKQNQVDPTNQYAEEVDSFVAACGGEIDTRIESGVENMAVLDAVRRACCSGAIEEL